MHFVIIYLVLEILISVTIIGEIGALATILEMVLTAAWGMFLLRNYKYAIVVNLMSLKDGKISQTEFMKQNLFVALGAILLIIPGFMTDFIGILLQFSFIASIFSSRVLKKDNNKNKEQEFKYYEYKKGDDDDVIDVEIIDDKHSINK